MYLVSCRSVMGTTAHLLYSSRLSVGKELTNCMRLLKKKVNFIVFMKHQKRCFTNNYFELPHEVGGYLSANATNYVKNVSGLKFLASFARTSLPIVSSLFPATLPPVILLPYQPRDPLEQD
jgi:hypothetical protein